MFQVFAKVPFAYSILYRKTLKLFAFPVLHSLSREEGWGLGPVRAGASIRTKH